MRSRRSIQLSLAGVLTGLALAGAQAPATAAPDPATCVGQPPQNLPPIKPGPIRWGINPRAQVGQLGPLPATAIPEDPAQQVKSLGRLSAGHPFVLRLNRIFWPPPAGQLARLDADVALYGGAGYLLELQLRYHPASGETATSPSAFSAWAADLVHRYDANPGLVSVQVTNEANFGLSADSSDGGFTYVKDALIRGVQAVHQQVALDHAGARLRVGFNWFYRNTPNAEKSFWTYLRDNGGQPFLSALDWVGLDAYPGTAFLPIEPPGGYYTGMVNALSTLHDCLMAYAGIDKPIYVEETGFFTEGPDPSPKGPAVQLEALRELTAAAHDYAGLYGVSDLRWFDLRDADSSSPNPQQHYGLLNSDYSPKPAFCAYSQLVSGNPCPAVQASPAPPGPAGPPVDHQTVTVRGAEGMPGTSAPRPDGRFLVLATAALVGGMLMLGLLLA